jgi:hypothetical protein
MCSITTHSGLNEIPNSSTKFLCFSPLPPGQFAYSEKWY